jgi:ubiquinone/menaquinone biosynthesis C-methylase UbiE
MVQEPFYESYVARCSASFSEDRLEKVLRRLPTTMERGLDIGCGLGRNLRLLKQRFPNVSLVGLDVAQAAVDATRASGFEAYVADASTEIPYPDRSFDFVLCGEVIEHVVKTDNLLRETRRVLRPGGLLILTTPNLAYVPNRLLLLCGIQPLFTETSQFVNMGRILPLLGQGHETQGHLKIFTLRALRDILHSTQFHIKDIVGYRFFQTGPTSIVDRIFAMRPETAAGFVVAATPRESP